MSTCIRISDVMKKYGDKTVIPKLSLNIEGGEFFTLLGPSGCGKTTLLRMIAGFNSIESGTIYFDEKAINQIPPYKRDIGMVFQNYAIFPHMSVRENVEYGLKQRKIEKKQIRERSDKIMEMVKISEYADRSPNQLSGGQQQRVALARAIVIKPTVLLMDEPLSNLDAKLRVEMRSAIRDIQKSVGITTVYVTHDQEEALAVSDRIAVMNMGELQQVGTPIELYHRPANVFVATFVGTSMIFDAVCEKREGENALLVEGEMKIRVPKLSAEVKDQEALKVTVRPEEFTMVKEEEADGLLKGVVKSCVFLGKFINYEVALASGKIVEISRPTAGFEHYFKEGQTVGLSVDVNRINVFDGEGKRNLLREEEAYAEEAQSV